MKSWRRIAWLVAALCAGFAQAQSLSDPTRPPNFADAGTPAAESGAPVLQSVMIAGGRRSAIIGGQLVELGQMYGDAKLVRVTEGEVALAQGRDVTVLRLFPGVEKKLIVSPAPAKSGGARKKTKAGSRRAGATQ